MDVLRAKWGDDPDAIIAEDGTVKFVGPKGKIESETEHMHRLAHNARMWMHRSITGYGLYVNPLFKHDKQYSKIWSFSCSCH